MLKSAVAFSSFDWEQIECPIRPHKVPIGPQKTAKGNLLKIIVVDKPQDGRLTFLKSKKNDVVLSSFVNVYTIFSSPGSRNIHHSCTFVYSRAKHTSHQNTKILRIRILKFYERRQRMMIKSALAVSIGSKSCAPYDPTRCRLGLKKSQRELIENYEKRCHAAAEWVNRKLVF